MKLVGEPIRSTVNREEGTIIPDLLTVPSHFSWLIHELCFKLLMQFGPLLRKEQGTNMQLSVGAEPLLSGDVGSQPRRMYHMSQDRRGNKTELEEWTVCFLARRSQARPGERRHWWDKQVLLPAVPLVTPDQHPSSCKKPSSLSISWSSLNKYIAHVFAFIILHLFIHRFLL